MQFESHQAECSIPWLNEILVFLTVTLQLCQQLKDKVCIRFFVNEIDAKYFDEILNQNNFFVFFFLVDFSVFPIQRFYFAGFSINVSQSHMNGKWQASDFTSAIHT